MYDPYKVPEHPGVAMLSVVIEGLYLARRALAQAPPPCPPCALEEADSVIENLFGAMSSQAWVLEQLIRSYRSTLAFIQEAAENVLEREEEEVSF